MNPFENVHSEDEAEKRPNFPLRTRDVHTGRFVAGPGDFGNGMSAEIVSVVEKAKDSKKGEYAAIAGGSGAITAATFHNRIGNAVDNVSRRRFDRKVNRASSAYGADYRGRPTSDPRASMPKDSAGRTVYSSKAERKAARSAASKLVRNKHRYLHELKSGYKPPMGGSGRSKLLAGGLVTGVPLVWGGSRSLAKKSKVEKSILPKNERDIDAGVLGTGAGVAGYQGVGYALKPLDRRAERKIAADDDLSAKAKEWTKASGRKKHAKAGDPSWQNYFRNYPKDLPGAKLKRTLARTHTGKGGVALTAAAGLASGATAVHLNQQREKVKKAWTQAPAAPKPQLPKLPATPKSPVAAVARPKVARPVQPTQRKEPEKPKVKQTGVGMNINKSMPDASAVHILGTIKRKKKKGKVSKSFVPGKGWVSATSVPKKVLRGASGKNTHAKMRQVSPEDQNFKGLNRAARQAYGDNKSPKRVEQQLFDSEIDYKVSRGKNARRAPIKRIDADTDIGGGIAAFAAQTGGRRGQRYMVVGQAGKSDWGKKVVEHEQAHLGPKRSSYRLARQISGNPKKAAREEARADWISGMKYKAIPNKKVKRAMAGEDVGTSGYSVAARSEPYRKSTRMGMALSGNPTNVQRIFDKKPMAEYRGVQDKIASAEARRRRR